MYAKKRAGGRMGEKKQEGGANEVGGKKEGGGAKEKGGGCVIAGSNAALLLFRVAPAAKANPGRQVSRCRRRIPALSNCLAVIRAADGVLRTARGASPVQYLPLPLPIHP